MTPVEGVGPLQQGLRPVTCSECDRVDGHVEGVGPLQQGLRPYSFLLSVFFLYVEGVGPLQQGLRLIYKLKGGITFF